MALSLAISPPSARSLPPSVLSTGEDVELGSCATASLVLVQGGDEDKSLRRARRWRARWCRASSRAAREVEARTGKAGVKDNGAAEG